MNFKKVGDVVKDWVHGNFRFGNNFTNNAASHLEVSPKTARWGGAAFDTLAGAGITLLGVKFAVGNALSVVAAAAAITAAPATALVGIAVGTVFFALSCMMTGMGVGFLNAARHKIVPGAFVRNAREAVYKGAESVKNTFKVTQKPGKDFKKAANSNTPSVSKDPLARNGTDFKL